MATAGSLVKELAIDHQKWSSGLSRAGRDLKGFGFQTGGKVQAQEGSQVKVRTPAKKSAKK